MTPAEAIAQYKDKVPAALERVRGMSGEQFASTIHMFGAFQMPAVASCSSSSNMRCITAAS